MTTRIWLMRGAAVGGLIAITAGSAAQAAVTKTTTVETTTTTSKLHHHHQKAAVRRHSEVVAGGSTSDEIRELREEVHALQARLDAQSSAQSQTRAEVRQTAAQVEAAQSQLQMAQSQAAQAQQQAQAQIATIPTQVATAVAAVKPKTDAFYYKGLKITPGGFLEAANIYRTRNLGSDIASPFNAIPFANTRTGHEAEDKFSARQTRLSMLVQGDVNPNTQLSMYGEFDFQAAAQTANPNESNSWSPRIRHLYGALDMNDSGWHVLAGETWSLATMNSKGITPRNEVTPPQIDAQYVPGFVWARQAQLRVTKDLIDKTLWFAVSAENPQTTFAGSLPPGVVNLIANGSGFFAGATGATAPVGAGGSATPATPTAATQSLNYIPDFIGKVAYEVPVYGRTVHLEAFGIARAFTDRINTSQSMVYGGGVGAGFIVQAVPGLLDLQGSALTGKGIGRYGSSQLPDVTFRGDGRIETIPETDFLAGGTVHATKMLDIYAFAGEEHVDRQVFAGGFGYGPSTYSSAGCFTEGGSCGAATKFVEQVTLGFWQKIYQGPFGRAQFGVQYSYTERHSFSGVGGFAPIANDSMLFTSFRYYPF